MGINIKWHEISLSIPYIKDQINFVKESHENNYIQPEIKLHLYCINDIIGCECSLPYQLAIPIYGYIYRFRKLII